MGLHDFHFDLALLREQLGLVLELLMVLALMLVLVLAPVFVLAPVLVLAPEWRPIWALLVLVLVPEAPQH
jgi:hypothetical protein